jgi:hypothetical protein
MSIVLDQITINGANYVLASSVKTPLAEPVDGLRYCIVRCRDAGVHAGFVKHHNWREVTLLNSRRLWCWYGKTLSGLATEGSTNEDGCKYADEIPEIVVLDACEIIPCTQKGMDSIRYGVGPWKNS